MRYRSKPSEIEAIQWLGDNLEEVEAFGVKFRYADRWEHPLQIKAGKDGAQGYVSVPFGHWIVRQPGDLSDHWPVEADYFANKYEPTRAVEDLLALDEILASANGDDGFYDRLMVVISEGQQRGVLDAVCDTHDGLPLTAAEEHDLEVHGLDRCVPAFRVYGPEHSEADGCSSPGCFVEGED